MVPRVLFYKKIRPWLLSAAVVMALLAGPVSNAPAAEADRDESYGVVQDSLKAMWLGEEFNSELKQKQQALKDKLQSGSMNKAALEAMLGRAFSAILDQHKTSRYIMARFPGRAEAMFSPVMTWPEVKKIFWRTLVSPVKKEEPIVFKIATLAPPGTPWVTVPDTTTIPEIEKLTDGKIIMKIYRGGVMGEDGDVLKKMDSGEVDGCGCSSAGLLAASPEIAALLMPGLFNNYEEVDYIYEKLRKRLDKAFEERGYLLVSLIDTGFYYVFSKNKINGLSDLKKLKMLSWSGSVETTFYQELGITAMPVAVPEIVLALNTGVGDAFLAPPAWVIGMQAYQNVNYYFKPPLAYSPGADFVSIHTKDRIKKQIGLSDTYAFNTHELVVSEFNALEQEWKRQIRYYEQKSLQAFETKCGMKAVTFSPEDLQTISKASKTVREKLAGKAYSADMMDEIVKALEEYRARH